MENFKEKEERYKTLLTTQKVTKKALKTLKDEFEDNGYIVYKKGIVKDEIVFCLEYGIGVVDRYVGEKGCLTNGLHYSKELSKEVVEKASNLFELIKGQCSDDVEDITRKFMEYYAKNPNNIYKGDAYEAQKIFSHFYGDILDISQFNVEKEFNVEDDLVFEINQLFHCDGNDGEMVRGSHIRISKRKKSWIKQFNTVEIEDEFDVDINYTPYKK